MNGKGTWREAIEEMEIVMGVEKAQGLEWKERSSLGEVILIAKD